MAKKANQLRPIEIITNYTKHAAGSVLIKRGDTWVLCTASVEERVPPFLRDTGRGWVTAEYAMLPSSTGGGRKERDIKKLKMDEDFKKASIVASPDDETIPLVA